MIQTVFCKRLLTVLLVTGSIGFVCAGCSGSAASPSKNSKSAASSAQPAHAQARHAQKSAPRESSYSVYSNPDYGVSFHYPRNYALQDGTQAQSDAIPEAKTQEQWEAEQPGAILLASVVIPEDAYPNTTFVGGSLQFVVNRSITAESCGAALILQAEDPDGPIGMINVHEVLFSWAEDVRTADATDYLERDYAGFSNGTCYEFFLRVDVGSEANDDGVRKADAQKVLWQLEKIVSSLQIVPPPAASLPRKQSLE
jgi:hypothetical protein